MKTILSLFGTAIVLGLARNARAQTQPLKVVFPSFSVATDPRAAKAKPEEFYDNSALQRLEQAGFFKN